jgi:hypothetical protein
MSEVVGAIKARQPAADTAVAFVQTPTNRAAFTASTTSQVVAGIDSVTLKVQELRDVVDNLIRRIEL